LPVPRTNPNNQHDCHQQHQNEESQNQPFSARVASVLLGIFDSIFVGFLLEMALSESDDEHPQKEDAKDDRANQSNQHQSPSHTSSEASCEAHKNDPKTLKRCLRNDHRQNQ
jgi:hypothetical protein